MTEVDILSREDVKLMVDTFYDKVNRDPLLDPIFNAHSKVNWETHLPIMYRFWNSLLIEPGEYKGAPFDKHIPLPISKIHFDRWLVLFHETVDELFHGEKATEAKLRAQSIAYVFQTKLEHIHGNN